MNTLHASNIVTFHCKECGKPTTKRVSWLKSPSFCSKVCQKAAEQKRTRRLIDKQTMARKLVKENGIDPTEFSSIYR